MASQRDARVAELSQVAMALQHTELPLSLIALIATTEMHVLDGVPCFFEASGLKNIH